MSAVTALCGAGQAMAQGDKDASLAEMLGLAQQMNALKALAPTDPASASAYEDALQRYEFLSLAFGGDDPGQVVQGSNSSQPAQSGPAVAGGVPAGCNTTLSSFPSSAVVAIPTGPAVITSSIAVSAVEPYLIDLDLTTFITHTFPGDIDMTLTSPAGTVVTLTSDNAGTNDNVFNGTLWDDDANPGGQVPYTANNGLVTDQTYAINTLASPLAAEEALGAFIGEDPNGTWTLTISDDAAGDGGSLDSWSLGITTLPGAPNIVSEPTATQATPTAIPTGPAVVTSTLVVAGAGTAIHDIDATTFITHTFPGDIDMTLTSPAGTVVTLTSDNGGTNDNVFNGTQWDDDANPGGQVPYTANDGLVTDHTYAINTLASPLAPEEAMAAFIGEDPNGTWTLTISDDAAGDGGSLDSWSLDIDTFTCVVPGAGVSGTKTVSGNTIPGGAITYTIVLSNAGPGQQNDNPGDEFVDILPAQVTVDAISATSGTVTEAGGTVSWNGAIVAGGSVTITIDATVSAGAFGQIDNQGTINFDSDGDGTNDASTVTDDPSVGGQADPTGFLIARTIPTLGTIGLILLALGLLVLIWHRREYLQRR